MDVQLVLELSAIAAVVSAGISYLTFRKTSNLTYITQERKAWREDIRRIAEELEDCHYEERKRVLVQLKTRLNAYGLTDGNELNDAHIWQQIEKIEKFSVAEYDVLKEQLIRYLSLLLKYDWERSKKEVYGNPFQIIGYALSTLALILFAMGLTQIPGTNIRTDGPVIIEIILVIGCSVLLIAYMVKQERKNGDAHVVFYPGLLIFVLSLLFILCGINKQLNDSYLAPAIVAGFFATGIQLKIELAEILDKKIYLGYVRDIKKKD